MTRVQLATAIHNALAVYGVLAVLDLIAQTLERAGSTTDAMLVRNARNAIAGVRRAS